MRKAIITQEQADAIEHRLKRFDRDFIMDLHEPMKDDWINESAPLNELSNSELAKALYIGYEVEPEFKVGGWVVPHSKSYLGNYRPQKITNIDDIKTHIRYFLEDGLWSGETQIRHATPEEIAEEKERRWWKKHGRQPWELRFDDVLIHKEKHEIIRVIDVQSKGEVIVFINGGYRETLNITYVKQLYSVVCFAEDRKDVKE